LISIALMIWGTNWHSRWLGPVWIDGTVSSYAVRRIKAGLATEMSAFAGSWSAWCSWVLACRWVNRMLMPVERVVVLGGTSGMGEPSKQAARTEARPLFSRGE